MAAETHMSWKEWKKLIKFDSCLLAAYTLKGQDEWIIIHADILYLHWYWLV